MTTPREGTQSAKALVVDVAGKREPQALDPQLARITSSCRRRGVNLYDLLRHDTLVLSKDAAKALEQRCLRSAAASSVGTGDADAKKARPRAMTTGGAK